jgi:flavin-dependent dehydrogenase
MTLEQERLCPARGDTPALYFCRDLLGYGWLFRKGNYLNVGLGRLDRQGIRQHMRDFQTFLEQQGALPPGTATRFQGHAYLLAGGSSLRSHVSDGALLIGDAAGLAHRQSGEGILPAIESANLAADTVIAAKGDYRRSCLGPYEAHVTTRLSNARESVSSPRISGLVRFFGASFLDSRWFARHIVLNRWFLHAERQPLYPFRTIG